MQVNTTRFGLVEIDEESVISISEGMIGFGDHKSFCLIEHRPESLFRWLQSTDDAALAFLVIEPGDFFLNYEFELSDWDVELLGLADAEEAVVVTTVTVDTAAGHLSTNLVAPIVINGRNRLGKQIVLDDGRYSVDQLLCRLNDASVQSKQALAKAA